MEQVYSRGQSTVITVDIFKPDMAFCAGETTGQPAITASQLRDNVSRGLRHRDRRSVSWCMSVCTIVVVDQCVVVCQ